MDPALRELLRAERRDPERVVEAIVRFRFRDAVVPGVRVVARFGTVATCRIRARDVVAVRRHPLVASCKASRGLGPEHQTALAATGDVAEAATDPVHRPTDRRRPEGTGLTGRGVVVAALDWGLDFAAACFRRADGSTRLLALLDQRDRQAGARGSPSPYGYGTVFSSADIDAALRTDQPYLALGYHPADADAGTGAHGSHVLDIAAGNGRSGGPAGVACDADLAFVHLADRDTGGLANLGDSLRLLEGLDFVRRTAAGRPWVVNDSVGRHAGPHDGCTPAEMAVDQLLLGTPGCFVVQSAGNYYRSGTHSTGHVPPGGRRTMRFSTHPDDSTPNEVEVWYPGVDELVVELTPPGSDRPVRAALGEVADVVVAGEVVGRVYHREDDPNNHDNMVDAFLYVTAPPGEWTLTLLGRSVVDGTFHAWIERDQACPHCQSRFRASDASPTTTTGTLANGRLPLVVGAYDAHQAGHPLAPFSSSGWTRDDRVKPDLVARGVDELALRSAPAECAGSPDLLVRKSGTSMATPHVTGAVALCLEAGGRRLPARRIRSLVLGTASPSPPAHDPRRAGRGLLDLRALTDRLRADFPHATTKETTMIRTSWVPALVGGDSDPRLVLAAAPATAYRELLYRPDGRLGRWVGERFEVVARPGEALTAATRPGDVLLGVTLGSRSRGRCDILDAPLESHRSRVLPPGRLLLRPRSAPEPDDSDAAGDLAENDPGHVVRARKVWCRLGLPSGVTILDMTQVPSTQVRGAGFQAWTNSASNVYVDASADAPGVMEAVLHHEACHVRDFRKAKRRPPTYAHMMRYECDAYTASDRWTKNHADADVRATNGSLADSAKLFCDEIAAAGRARLSRRALDQRYRTFLLSTNKLPAHQDLGALYLADPQPPRPTRCASTSGAQGAGEDVPETAETRLVATLLRDGRSENDITDAVFFARHPGARRGGLRSGSAKAREWTRIRDDAVRPAARRALALGTVDPVELALYLSQYEGDSRVPADVTRQFLTEPVLLSLGRSLRDRVISNWRLGRRPLDPARLHRIAVDLTGDVGAATLLCHNVLKAFVRSGTAITWRGTGQPGEYTDGRTTYVAAVVHPSGRMKYAPTGGTEKVSIFYLLFSDHEFGTADPGDWYHFFVTASMVTLAADAGGGSGGRRSRDATDAEDRGGRASSVAYRALLSDRMAELAGAMTDSALAGVPTYRGWVRANAISFLEGGFYGKDYTQDQGDVARESRVHLRGAVFGLRTVGGAPGSTWRWYVPKAGSISQTDLAFGVDLRASTAEVLRPDGTAGTAGAGGDEVHGDEVHGDELPWDGLQSDEADSLDAEWAAPSALLLDSENDPYRELLDEIARELRLRFTDPDDPGVRRRRLRLRTLFARVPADRRRELRNQLGVERTGDDLSRLFHGRLHRATRRELLQILDRAAPGPVAPTAPAPPSRPSFVSPHEPLPPGEYGRLDAAVRSLRQKIDASNDPRAWRYRCWLTKLAAGADDRVIPWYRICPRTSGAIGAAYLVGPCDITAGSAVDQTELERAIRSVPDVEPANRRLFFITHLRPQILWLTELTSDQFHLENLGRFHDQVQMAVSKLDLWANNPMGGSSAMPPAYVSIKDWIGQRQRDPNSLYSCL